MNLMVFFNVKRTNYGLFLDPYTAVLTLDTLLEKDDLPSAARVASALMLQEEDDPLSCSLGRLAVWRYWAGGKVGWEEGAEEDENPDEVIRVRVRMVPNEYTDEHFDLRDPDKILGKTMVYLGELGEDNIVNRSLRVLGLGLWGKTGEMETLIDSFGVDGVARAVLEGMEVKLGGAEVDMEGELLARSKECINEYEKEMSEKQKMLYKEWNKFRENELQR